MKFGMNRGRAGLTLLEVMVVVVIMGMIAAIVSKVVIDKLEMAKVETAKTQMHEIAGALDLFYLDNSFYPSTEQGLEALVTKPASGRAVAKYPERGYMPRIPRDPWGFEYVYVCPGTRSDYEVICLGRDGVEGGEGFDADLSSWEMGAAPK